MDSAPFLHVRECPMREFAIYLAAFDLHRDLKAAIDRMEMRRTVLPVIQLPRNRPISGINACKLEVEFIHSFTDACEALNQPKGLGDLSLLSAYHFDDFYANGGHGRCPPRSTFADSSGGRHVDHAPLQRHPREGRAGALRRGNDSPFRLGSSIPTCAR